MKKPKYPSPFTILDQDGQVVEGQLALIKVRGPVLQDWIRMFEQGLLKILDARLKGESLNMLLFLMSQVDFNNRVACDKALCFACTNITPKNQMRPIRLLVGAGLLKETDKINSTFIYSLDPLLAWKGNARTYPEAVRQYHQIEAEKLNLSLSS